MFFPAFKVRGVSRNQGREDKWRFLKLQGSVRDGGAGTSSAKGSPAMSQLPAHSRKILFVDDDLAFLEMIERSFRGWSKEESSVHLAHSAGQAISLLQQQTIDVAVLDIRMPVVDGLQFLHLLHRKHPNVRKVVLTGYAEQDFRAACLKGGAELFLEKPRTVADFDSVFASVSELCRAHNEEGFHGNIRNIGLHEILQLECLARRSSILEVSCHGASGQIFIKEGAISHAETASLAGQDAFYFLMSLRGGTFNLRDYEEPKTETIQGPWEYLLMESSRMRDEGEIAEETTPPLPSLIADVPMNAFTPGRAIPQSVAPPAALASAVPPPAPKPARTKAVAQASLSLLECVAFSEDGKVTKAVQSSDAELRANFMAFLKFKSKQLSQSLGLGTLRSVEAHTLRETIVADIRRDGGTFARCKPQHARRKDVLAAANVALSKAAA
jgi:CheY-like chemotaxis protein